MPVTLTRKLLSFSLLLLVGLASSPGRADIVSAEAAMEDPGNPLLLITTSAGELYVELLPREAPNNVANFLALAEGEVEIADSTTDATYRPRYFDGLRFHRVVPGFVIQAGSPSYHPLGAPSETLADEINANSLGLDREYVLKPDGSINSILGISSQQQFADSVLTPLYQRMNIDSAGELAERQDDVLGQLQSMTVQDVYENQGYRYIDSAPSRPVTRAIVALANSGPDSNGPEFFISLNNTAGLTGKYTVIGRVTEGMDIVDQIGSTAIDPQRFSRLSTVIYSIRRLN